jgi:microcin C transport system permease protein
MGLSLNQRRWQKFKQHRRGWWSLWVLTTLTVLSLFAEFIANDKPILVRYAGEWYTPVFSVYPETTFGGEFPTEADYRDEYVRDLITKSGYIIWPMIPFSPGTTNYQLTAPAPTPPSTQNWLGTDDQGRDVLARLIYGFRTSILFGLSLTLISSLIGVVAGLVQGYFGGWIDLLGQRFIEIWSGLPQLFILIILASMVDPNFWWLLGIMSLFSWLALEGIVRAEVLRVRNFDYVRAARALGVHDVVIMFRHILPNAMVSTLSRMPFVMVGSVSLLASLDYLGYGLPTGTPSIGELLKLGKMHLQAPWLGLTAFTTLAVLLTLIAFIGEAARDAFDPRKTLT